MDEAARELFTTLSRRRVNPLTSETLVYDYLDQKYGYMIYYIETGGKNPAWIRPEELIGILEELELL